MTDAPGDLAAAWRGFHHIAVVTPDFDATRAFYGELLEMHVGDILQQGGTGSRHCFISPGDGAGLGLHVFEYSDAQMFPYPQEAAHPVFVPGMLQHIAFALQDAGAAATLRARLRAHGIEPWDAHIPGPMASMLFFDNNGLMLEATWPATQDNPAAVPS